MPKNIYLIIKIYQNVNTDSNVPTKYELDQGILVGTLVLCFWWTHFLLQRYFGPRVYQMGSRVISLVRQSVSQSVSLSLNSSEIAHQFFLKFCIKLGVNKVKKSDTARNMKKILIRALRGIKYKKLGSFDIFSETSH